MSDRGTYSERQKVATNSDDDVTATGAGTWITASRFREAVLWVTTGTVTGTNPTLDVKLQSSPDKTAVADIASGAVAQLTTSTESGLIAVDGGLGEYIRPYYTIGGTDTPTFPVTVWLTLKT